MLSLALGASLILAWQPRDEAIRQARWRSLHARPDALPLETSCTASRAVAVHAFTLAGRSPTCSTCRHAPTLEPLSAGDAPDPVRLVAKTSAGTAVAGSILMSQGGRARSR
jgi:hypothetical protein